MEWVVPDWYQRTPKEEVEGRISLFQALLRENEIESALIGDTVAEKVDLFYLSGTMQQAHLYVPAKGSPLLLVRKDLDRARLDSPLNRIVPLKSTDRLADVLREQGYSLPTSLGLQLAKVPAQAFLEYRSGLGEPQVVDLSQRTLLRTLRMIKSPYEIALIRRAARIADAALSSIDGELLWEGMTEAEMAGRLEAVARREGHQGILRMDNAAQESFYGQCVSGADATVPTFFDGPLGGWGLSPAMPQSVGLKTIHRGEPIVLDFVAVFNGYVADQTRMAVIGSLPSKLLRAYEAMRDIQEAVMREMRPGVRSREIYELAQNLAQELRVADHFMGYGEKRARFIGHGVGLTMDDLPVITSSKRFDTLLQPGMVIALEPKAVFPDEGVVGIEDTLLITPAGCESLTLTGKGVIAVR